MNDIHKKYLTDMRVVDVRTNGSGYSELLLTPVNGLLPEILPGQFVNVRVTTSQRAYLRRPISVNDVNVEDNTLRLLVKDAGEATHIICNSRIGDVYDILLPLGKPFTIVPGARYLLVGGGVGTAPMLYLGKKLKEAGMTPTFLLGARTSAELMQLDRFRRYGEVFVCTEDGSLGTKGFVTAHEVLQSEFDRCCVCGPMPMMKAVAAAAKSRGVECEVSLENKMACGLGACLCCVEDTVRGNECTCTAGPVFNINDLKWQI